MIRIRRGREPRVLRGIRAAELARVGAVATPTSDDVGTRYQEVQPELYARQFYKCCYCEFMLQQKYNDVEHYRPKAEADRLPGSTATHGYWWLAWTWKNLLFSCPTCNRSHKRTQFPLDHGSTALSPTNPPPGAEKPLLLDPAGRLDPRNHIQFEFTSLAGRRYWIPRPRGASPLGKYTIEVVRLDRADLLDHYNKHVELMVMPVVNRLGAALAGSDRPTIRTCWAEQTQWLLNTRFPFTALSYDALAHFFPPARRQPHNLTLPRPRPL